MNAVLHQLGSLRPNPDWASLPIFERKGWKRLPFGKFADSINERVDPANAAEESYVGLDDLDPGSLHIRRWGKGSDVIGIKLRFRKGDIIFGRRRAYQRKLAVAEFDGICSAHAMVVRAKPDMVLPEFLPFLMMSDKFMNRAVEISVGSLSPTINWTTLKLQEFDLPPIEQQRRIVEVLWATDDVIHYENHLLYSSHTAYETKANDFFFGHDQKHSLFNPKWNTVRLQDVNDPNSPIRYGIVQVGAYCKSGIPTVAIKNLSGNFKDDLHYTAPEIEAQYSGSRVKPKDLLLSIKATIGEVAIVPEYFEGNISRDIARIRCNSFVDPRLFLHLFRSNRYKSYIDKYVVGSTRKEISIHHLRKFEVPIPPPKAVQYFLESVEEILKTFSSIYAHSRASIELRNSIIGGVF